MTDRMLRWLSAISLALLALNAARSLAALPSFPVHLGMVLDGGPAFIFGYAVLPLTTGAFGEVSGVATLLVSLQRKQWGWFGGALLCLVVHFYAGLVLSLSSGIGFLYKLAGSVYTLGIYVTLYSLLALAPIVVLAFVYTWTRHQPPVASTSG